MMYVSCVVSGKSLFYELTPIQAEDLRETCRQCAKQHFSVLSSALASQIHFQLSHILDSGRGR